MFRSMEWHKTRKNKSIKHENLEATAHPLYVGVVRISQHVRGLSSPLQLGVVLVLFYIHTQMTVIQIYIQSKPNYTNCMIYVRRSVIEMKESIAWWVENVSQPMFLYRVNDLPIFFKLYVTVFRKYLSTLYLILLKLNR